MDPLSPAARAWLALLLGCIAIVPRLLIYLWIQFPAPTGDGILFASVASYRCREGIFATPLFPLDPTGSFRYIWHGIGQPAWLSALAIGCGHAALFAALSATLVLTLAISYRLVVGSAGRAIAILFALVVFALQVKQGFRPETLALPVVLLAESARLRLRHPHWIYALFALAWIHPTVCVLHALYVLCTGTRPQWQRLFNSATAWVPAVLVLAAAAVLFYPFGIGDLLAGLARQGQLFSKRDDGDIVTEYLRSDFFPLFGVALLIAFVLRAARQPALIFMLPAIWFYALRVPPTYYNAIPLFVALLFGLVTRRAADEATRIPSFSGYESRLVATTVALVAALAWLGLLQGNVRDLYSYAHHGATLERAVARYEQLQADATRVCRLPAFFTLALPSSNFQPSYEARSSQCALPEEAGGKRVDLSTATPLDDTCERWPDLAPPGVLDRLFARDSGYSFSVCPLKF